MYCITRYRYRNEVSAFKLTAKTLYEMVSNECVFHSDNAIKRLKMQISQRSMEERMLKLTVYDVDRYKRNRIIGHALYSLQGHDSLSNERLVIWRDLERDVTEVINHVTNNVTLTRKHYKS